MQPAAAKRACPTSPCFRCARHPCQADPKHSVLAGTLAATAARGRGAPVTLIPLAIRSPRPESQSSKSARRSRCGLPGAILDTHDSWRQSVASTGAGAILDTHDSRRPIRCVNRLWNGPRVSPRCSPLPRNVRVQRAPALPRNVRVQRARACPTSPCVSNEPLRVQRAPANEPPCRGTHSSCLECVEAEALALSRGARRRQQQGRATWTRTICGDGLSGSTGCGAGPARARHADLPWKHSGNVRVRRVPTSPCLHLSRHSLAHLRRRS